MVNLGLPFVYFYPFPTTTQLKIEYSVDVVLGIQTWGCRQIHRTTMAATINY